MLLVAVNIRSFSIDDKKMHVGFTKTRRIGLPNDRIRKDTI